MPKLPKFPPPLLGERVYRYKAYQISWGGGEPGSYHRFVDNLHHDPLVREIFGGVGVVIFNTNPRHLLDLCRVWRVDTDSFVIAVGRDGGPKEIT